jgi:hypothetical protein
LIERELQRFIRCKRKEGRERRGRESEEDREEEQREEGAMWGEGIP